MNELEEYRRYSHQRFLPSDGPIGWLLTRVFAAFGIYFDPRAYGRFKWRDWRPGYMRYVMEHEMEYLDNLEAHFSMRGSATFPDSTS